jgi:glycopeptide antibiotics resistance protein
MRQRWVFAVILAAYSAILVRLLVFKGLSFNFGHLRIRITPQSGQTNFVPFRTILLYLHDHRPLAMVNMIGNVALFVPIGWLAPVVFRRMSWPHALILAASAGLFVEGTQFLLQVGEFDVDDLILNALGIAIGYAGFALVARSKRPPSPLGASGDAPTTARNTE